MIALERLSALERTAFLLHDVFDVPFEEVARAIGRNPAYVASSPPGARVHVRTQRPRYPVGPEERGAIASAFVTASGDIGQLRSLLAEAEKGRRTSTRYTAGTGSSGC